MIVQISCIVEGHGEKAAVPILIRRIASNCYPELGVVIPQPIRAPRSRVIREGELEQLVELAAQKVKDQGAIFILLDSDDDCPAQIGPEFLCRALEARNDLPIAVVLAKCEFEAWFLAAAESLRGYKGLKNDLEPPDNPEEIRDAKGWLKQRRDSRKYRETLDQPGLTDRFDLTQACQADSFDKCYRDIARLLDELRKASGL